MRRSIRLTIMISAAAVLSVGLDTSVQAQFKLPPPFPPAGTQSVTVGCQYSVDGGYQLNSNWRGPAQGTLVGGPAAWPFVRWLASDYPGPHPPFLKAPSYATLSGLNGGRFKGGLVLAPDVEALVLVNAGAVVRIRVPVSERSRLSLDYTEAPYYQLNVGPSGDGHYNRISDGASQVTFKACSLAKVDPYGMPGYILASQFDGWFIVAGAQCARIEIYTRSSNRPIVRQIPFGVTARSCPAVG
jgi:hypothetical protein